MIDFDFEVISNFIEATERSFNVGMKRLEQRYKEERMDQLGKTDKERFDDLLVNYQDDEHDLEQVKKLSYRLLIVGLYTLVENTVKRIARHLYTEVIGKEFDKFPFLKGQLNNDNVCNIIKLKGYRSIEELRLINNCVKHNDSRVSKTLAKYPGLD